MIFASSPEMRQVDSDLSLEFLRVDEMRREMDSHAIDGVIVIGGRRASRISSSSWTASGIAAASRRSAPPAHPHRVCLIDSTHVDARPDVKIRFER